MVLTSQPVTRISMTVAVVPHAIHGVPNAIYSSPLLNRQNLESVPRACASLGRTVLRASLRLFMLLGVALGLRARLHGPTPRNAAINSAKATDPDSIISRRGLQLGRKIYPRHPPHPFHSLNSLSSLTATVH